MKRGRRSTLSLMMSRLGVRFGFGFSLTDCVSAEAEEIRRKSFHGSLTLGRKVLKAETEIPQLEEISMARYVRPLYKPMRPGWQQRRREGSADTLCLGRLGLASFTLSDSVCLFGAFIQESHLPFQWGGAWCIPVTPNTHSKVTKVCHHSPEGAVKEFTSPCHCGIKSQWLIVSRRHVLASHHTSRYAAAAFIFN